MKMKNSVTAGPRGENNVKTHKHTHLHTPKYTYLLTYIAISNWLQVEFVAGGKREPYDCGFIYYVAALRIIEICRQLTENQFS